MTNRLENDYFTWLTSQISVPRRNTRTYDDLFRRLHDTEFVWIVPNDDNRLHDGENLRYEFMDGNGEVFDQPVSILEILVALSRRTAFTAGGDPGIWAWTLLGHLKLHKASDPLTGRKADRVEDILEALIWRTYERNGQGGFFPLKNSLNDQTKLEIWDQMNAYVNEMYAS